MITHQVLFFISAMIAPWPSKASVYPVDSTTLSVWWCLPFAGLLLSMALFPIFIQRFWHHHYGKVALAWGISAIVPIVKIYGISPGIAILLETFMHDYVPFITLVGSLYIISSSIHIRIQAVPGPIANSLVLVTGTLLASLIGTTGAAMLLIRPLLKMNETRRYKAHVVIFFIFLVCNIGGCLTPLGDPPLFLGFLNGVSFFWVTRHLVGPFLFCCAILFPVFMILDYVYKKRENLPKNAPGKKQSLEITGGIHIVFLFAVLCLILLSACWHPGMGVTILSINIPAENIIRDMGLIITSFLSFQCCKDGRIQNEFTWGPIGEIAKIFASIFVVAVPVMAILQAGDKGPLHSLIAMVTDHTGKPVPLAFFWICGILSAFLDNAPTYLVFFNIAGGNASALMESWPSTLQAISAGAVFMGAITYIGNAPNFMVKSVAETEGVAMPGFFGYLAWSFCFLVPVYAAMGLIFFQG